MADVCTSRGPLSAAERDALPRSAFGLPGKRAYPIPDVSHARNAKARAAQMERAGKLSPRERAKVDKRADAVLAKCDAGDDKGSGRLWAYVGLGAGVLTLAGVAVWWFWMREPSSSSSSSGGTTGGGTTGGGTPGEGWELERVEEYKGRTLQVLKENAGGVIGVPSFHWRIGDGGAISEKGYILAALAMNAARKFVDELEGEPLPPVLQPGEAAGLAQLEQGPGVALVTAGGTCQRIELVSLAEWLPVAIEMLEGLNLQAWSAAEIMDNMWSNVFPGQCPKLSELGGFTINGKPYAELVEQGDAFLDQEVIGLQGDESIEGLFAAIMVGEPYVSPPEIPVVQVNLGTDAPELEQYPAGGAVWWIVTTEKPVLLSGGNPSQEATWRVWGPDTNVVGEPVADGITGSRETSTTAAKAWINAAT